VDGDAHRVAGDVVAFAGAADDVPGRPLADVDAVAGVSGDDVLEHPVRPGVPAEEAEAVAPVEGDGVARLPRLAPDRVAGRENDGHAVLGVAEALLELALVVRADEVILDRVVVRAEVDEDADGVGADVVLRPSGQAADDVPRRVL
jgi:hypothetical protein